MSREKIYSAEEALERQHAANKRYRERNKDRIREQKKVWNKNAREATKEHRREYRNKWEKENRIRKEAYRIRRKFGIPTISEAEVLVRKREAGPCGCCGAANMHRRLMHIDHDHLSGAIRDVLCNKCNVTLGLVNDNPDHLRSLIAYIEKHR